MSRPIIDGLNRLQRYRQKPHNRWRVRFGYARAHAKKRGVPFLLNFEEWRTIWEASGHWDQYGCRKGQYCMARYGDKGAYEVGNVRICTTEENHAEWLTEDHRKLLSDSLLGERNPNYGKNWSSLTPEQRGANSKKMWANMTVEQRAVIAQKKRDAWITRKQRGEGQSQRAYP